MALISEWMEQCGKTVLDDAGIVRDAILRQLRAWGGGGLSAYSGTIGSDEIA